MPLVRCFRFTIQFLSQAPTPTAGRAGLVGLGGAGVETCRMLKFSVGSFGQDYVLLGHC
jgi:hypothetical protein